MTFRRERYPANWCELRAAVQARAGDRCEQCGVANRAIGARDLGGDWHDERLINGMNSDQGFALFGDAGYAHIVQIVCTTAHKPGTDLMSQNLDDLLFLCRRCHLNLDRAQRMAATAATRARRKVERGQLALASWLHAGGVA